MAARASSDRPRPKRPAPTSDDGHAGNGEVRHTDARHADGRPTRRAGKSTRNRVRKAFPQGHDPPSRRRTVDGRHSPRHHWFGSGAWSLPLRGGGRYRPTRRDRAHERPAGPTRKFRRCTTTLITTKDPLLPTW